MTAEEKQGALATRGAVRLWTEEEKDLVWAETLKAKEENLPLTEAFRRCAKLLPHRSEAAIGMLYYNVLRKERKEPSPKPKPPPKAADFTVDPKLVEAFQGLPAFMQQLNKRSSSLEERLENPDPESILRALAGLAGSPVQGRTRGPPARAGRGKCQAQGDQRRTAGEPGQAQGGLRGCPGHL